ncbi:MAG: chemotaxis protein CheX [Deltaproteobacteria bacterium]|nr:chemotaxis protein CheX [Deltaproteobacteria bacterium]
MTSATSLNEQVAALVETIFESLSITVSHELNDKGDTFVRSSVALKGGFEGMIAVKCSTGLALELARRMYMSGDQAPSLDEAQDAVHEFANMIAGNIKGILGQAQMSLPSVPEQGASGVFPSVGQLASVDVPVGQALVRVTVLDTASRAAGL